MKTLRILSWIALAFGAALTARSAYLRVKAAVARRLIESAWNETLRTGRPTRPWGWADTVPLGRLRIARLGYDELVLEGSSPRNLAFGPVRMMSGAQPGEFGNLIVSGHRTSWFRPLEDVREGDTIQWEWRGADGRLRRSVYFVEELVVIPVEDTRYLRPTTEGCLTLVTCYPFGRGPRSTRRYVVRAYPPQPHEWPRAEGSCSRQNRGQGDVPPIVSAAIASRSSRSRSSAGSPQAIHVTPVNG